MKRTFFAAFVGILVLTIACDSVWAQATAQISGTAKDPSGAVLPGVEIHATQTETGVTRETVTNETGAYVLPNLPIGPYRLEATLPGFRTYTQTGIVLQVGSSPEINIALEVGQVSEQVEVQANATLVETRNVGVGQVMENSRILELPLNGRALIDLVGIIGTSTPAPIIDGSGGRDPFSKGNVSVAGGLNQGLNYTLDGAYHNNPFDNSYMSLPFPDAVQEFKIETGATGAQNSMRSSGLVSIVTKSGTNDFHGDLFEFVRNGMFNARNAFAARRDSLKRNQFGGTLGGAIIKNKLLFFGGYQGTTIRQDPSDLIQFVPTPAMLAGDFTAYAAPACNAGRQVTLRAPFVNNRIDPGLLSKPALALSAKLPTPTDACGTTHFGMPRPENDHMAIGRIDYQRSGNHSIFGRYMLDTAHTTAPFEITHSLLAVNNQGTGNEGRAQAFTLGDTYLIGSNVVNSFRLTTNRIYGQKFLPDFSKNAFGPADVGVRAFNYQPHLLVTNITGAFQTWCGGCGAGKTTAAVFAGSDEISILRGNHQFAFGVQASLWWTNSYSDTYSQLTMNFNGQTTSVGMADFLLGNVSSFTMGTNGDQQKRSRSYSMYVADTWKVNQKLTFNYGLRWEPYLPMVHRDGTVVHFDLDAARKGVKSSRFDNTPPGLFFIGDPGFQGGSAGMNNKLLSFSPRVGFAWDVKGDGRTSLRASVGTFHDYPSTYYLRGLANGAPWLPRYLRTNVDFANPWANEPGGDPFPRVHGKGIPRNVAWPPNAYVVWLDPNSQNMRTVQYNLSIQRQVGTDWLVSGSYIGSTTRHLWGIQLFNSAQFLGLNPCTLNGISYPMCSTTANQDQRRQLTLENPALGSQYGAIQRVDPGGTGSYNGLLLTVTRRAARGVTMTGNYTWSHCISDPGGDTAVDSLTSGWTNPNSRRFDRGNCATAGTDRRQVVNLSAVAETPRFSNGTLAKLGSGWRFSPIFRILSGDQLAITTNQDRALSGIGSQRVNQVLANPYGVKTVKNFLNPAAFALPAMGTLGNLGNFNIAGPGTWQFDAAVSRSFQLQESKRVEFRAEAFNVTNAMHMNDPTVNLNSNTFGQVLSAKDPRIMQFALKYVF